MNAPRGVDGRPVVSVPRLLRAIGRRGCGEGIAVTRPSPPAGPAAARTRRFFATGGPAGLRAPPWAPRDRCL